MSALQICPTGCALCGELVESPHWCVARYWARHLWICASNAKYRDALRALREEALQEQTEDEDNQDHRHSEIIPDLVQWGDWVWLRENNHSTSEVDRAAVRRVLAVLHLLTQATRQELRSLYVDRCSAARVAAKNGLPLPGYAPKGGRPKTISKFSVCEQAYLNAARLRCFG